MAMTIIGSSRAPLARIASSAALILALLLTLSAASAAQDGTATNPSDETQEQSLFQPYTETENRQPRESAHESSSGERIALLAQIPQLRQYLPFFAMLLNGHGTAAAAPAPWVHFQEFGGKAVQGTDGGDSLIGSKEDDVIFGGPGGDYLSGEEGDDTLFGEAGDDIIGGGPGDDDLRGGAGDDLIGGGDGRDTITGGEGNDIAEGGDGSDKINGDGGDDRLYGGNGGDSLNGGDGNDELIGDDDFDAENAGEDTLLGGDGNDYLDGGDADDNLQGDDGNDQMDGDDGRDTIRGGTGDDVIGGGTGGDEIDGDDGDDTIFPQSRTDAPEFPHEDPDENHDYVDCGAGHDIVRLLGTGWFVGTPREDGGDTIVELKVLKKFMEDGYPEERVVTSVILINCEEVWDAAGTLLWQKEEGED